VVTWSAQKCRKNGHRPNPSDLAAARRRIMKILIAAALVVLAYLLGSASPAYHLARAMRGVDLRKVGSGNLGARNVARELGRPYGIAVWLLDMAKGGIPVAIAVHSGCGTLVAVLCGTAAVSGHVWPVYYGFRGGRGASTMLGATFALLPVEMTAGLCLWVIVSHLSKSLYLGGVIAFPVTSAFAFLTGKSGPRALSPLIMAIPLVVKHVPAIVGMLRGRRPHLP
jgi:glycerol-3-phosphate acyltransferase PlsY